MVTELLARPGADEMAYPAPTEERFEDGGEFVVAPDLAGIAARLIEDHPRLGHLNDTGVICLWKKTGGKTRGVPTIGKCQKPSGMLKHFVGADFVVWLAADHARDAGLTQRQVEAALYHELLHTGVNEETGRPTTVGHDVEMFAAEIEEYGLWKADLQDIAPSFRQLRLDDERG